MRVFEIMSQEVHSVPPDAPLETAIHLMGEKRVRHLPVMRAGELFGILSDRDVLKATGWRPAAAREKLVRDHMCKEVKTLDHDDTLVGASMAIFTERVGCMPVLRDGQVCGMLSERDVFRTFVDQHQKGKLDPEAENPPVAEGMTTEVHVLTPEHTLDDAVGLCEKFCVRHVPLVEDQKYRSLLSDRDLRHAIGRDRPGTTKLRELMPRGTVRTCEDERVVEVVKSMLDVRISALPVLREDALVGIVTTENLLEHCMNTLWR